MSKEASIKKKKPQCGGEATTRLIKQLYHRYFLVSILSWRTRIMRILSRMIR